MSMCIAPYPCPTGPCWFPHLYSHVVGDLIMYGIINSEVLTYHVCQDGHELINFRDSAVFHQSHSLFVWTTLFKNSLNCPNFSPRCTVVSLPLKHGLTSFFFKFIIISSYSSKLVTDESSSVIFFTFRSSTAYASQLPQFLCPTFISIWRYWGQFVCMYGTN